MASADKTWLFILRVSNDIDHLTPVIWKTMKSGKKVRVLFVDKNANIEIDGDPRLRFLRRQGCDIRYPYALEGSKLSNRLLVSPTNPVKMKLRRKFEAFLLKHVWTPKWAERLLIGWNVTVVAVDLHEPTDADLEGRIVLAAKRLGVSTVALPHGPNVYISFPEGAVTSRPKRPIDVVFEGYKTFDAIVAPSPLEVPLWRQKFEPMERLLKLGSARFCPEWTAQYASLPDLFRPAKDPAGKTKVVFYLAQWGNNSKVPSVDREKTLEAIERLAQSGDLYLVVKEHTREGAGSLPEDLRRRYARMPNVEVIQSARSITFGSWARSGFRGKRTAEADSSALAAWADVTVVFGSSIGLEPLSRGKLFIDPLYLYKHATMYEALEVGVAVRSHEELLAAVKNYSKGIPYSTAKLDREMIYAGREPHDVLASYVDLLDALSKGKKPSATQEAAVR